MSKCYFKEYPGSSNNYIFVVLFYAVNLYFRCYYSSLMCLIDFLRLIVPNFEAPVTHNWAGTHRAIDTPT